MLKIKIKHNFGKKWDGNWMTRIFYSTIELVRKMKIENSEDVLIPIVNDEENITPKKQILIELYGLNCEETIQANFILELQSLFENIFPSEVRVDIVMVSPKLTLEKKISTEDLDPSLSFVREDLGPHDKFGF